MMHESKPRVARTSLAVAFLVGLATLGSAGTASASSKFPDALQKALSRQFPGVSFCVPLCTACHKTTTGGPVNLNVFGSSLENQPMPGNLILGNNGDVDKKVDTAIERYFAATPAAGLTTAITTFHAPQTVATRPSYDADGDGISDYDEFANGDSPSLPGAEGVGQFCPADAAQYGCFARVAAAPPPADRVGLLAAGLVVLGLAAFRRNRRPRPSA